MHKWLSCCWCLFKQLKQKTSAFPFSLILPIPPFPLLSYVYPFYSFFSSCYTHINVYNVLSRLALIHIKARYRKKNIISSYYPQTRIEGKRCKKIIFFLVGIESKIFPKRNFILPFFFFFMFVLLFLHSHENDDDFIGEFLLFFFFEKFFLSFFFPLFSFRLPLEWDNDDGRRWERNKKIRAHNTHHILKEGH